MIDRGKCVVRVYLPYVSNVIESLGGLAAVKAPEPKTDHLYALFNAHYAINEFIYGSIWSESLRVSLGPGKRLLAIIAKIYESVGEEPDVSYSDAATLSQQSASFRTVLEAEFQTAGIYLVTARRGYDIPTLLESAETIFPPEVVKMLPEIVPDLQEAGKCIAFNLGTAAGFHVLRALETVVCCYWASVMNNAPLPTNRNLGNYINEMAKGDHPERKKVLLSLRQVKDCHRNSIMHPEENLNLDQAIALMNVVQSAMVTMVNSIEREAGLHLMKHSATAQDENYELVAETIRDEASARRKQLKPAAVPKRLGKGKQNDATKEV